MKGPGFKTQDAPPIGGVAVLAGGKREPVAGAEPSAAPRACGATGVKSYGQGPEGGVKERLQELQARHAAQGVDAWLGGPQGAPPFARLTLSRIFVPKESRGRGVGTSFMKDLVAMADAEGVAITLTPDTSFGGSSVSRLKAFYKRFGFFENKGRHKDWTISETMIRYPFGRDGDLPHVVKSLPLAVGRGFMTGKPADLPWMHNEAPSAKVSWAGQEVEPAGFYVIDRFDLAPDREPLPGWAYGEGHLACPLVLAFGGGYLEPSNWKRALSETYSGLVGKALTRALLRDGFDSIVTVDKERECLSEIVLLNRAAKVPRTGPLDRGARQTSPFMGRKDSARCRPLRLRLNQSGVFCCSMYCLTAEMGAPPQEAAK